MVDSTSARGLRHPLAKALLGTLLVFALLEGAVRVVFDMRLVGGDRFADVSLAFDYGFADNPACSRRGENWVCGPSAYRRGLYEQSLPATVAPDAIRFVALGGSISAGGHESYPHQLRAILEDRRPTVDWQSANLSHGGFGTSRMLVLMKQVDRLEPHIVILDPTGTNEFEDERAFQMASSFRSGLGSILYQSGLLVLVKKLWLNRGTAVVYDGPTEEMASEDPENLRRWYRSLEANLDEMIRLARAGGSSVVLMLRATADQIQSPRLVEINRIIASFAGPDVRVFDTHEIMHRSPGVDARFESDRSHLSAEGHRTVALGLADWIVDELPAVRGPGQTVPLN